MIDMIMVTLNDPDVMGKDVFGKKRITEVVLAVSKNFDKYHGALEKGPEADYYQDKLDDALGAFLGDSLQPFETRYGWIKKQKY
jgi:hypothetical protein